MKKFGFSLQYLLDTHRAKEQAAEQALLQAMQEKAKVEVALQQKTAMRTEKVKAFEGMNGVIQRQDYAAYIRNIERLQRELTHMKQCLVEQDEQVAQCRVALRQEMTSRKIMENLYEKEKDEWTLELQQFDQKMMDELAVVRWSRQEK